MFFLATVHKNLRNLSKLLIFSAALSLTACKKEASTPLTPVEEGRKLYVSTCIACHNIDPKKPGGIGPEIWGSSQELLSLRILKGKYPDGYKPKRETKIMTMFPFSDEQIANLHAFLNAQ